MNSSTHVAEGFAGVLKQWRKRRRLSQLALSTLAATSSRHISFLEKGRAKPSREMVLKLGAAMDIPPSDINAGLTLAGFANAFPKALLNDESVQTLKRVVDTLLNNHLPLPAVACDQSWEILNKNAAAKHLLELANMNSQTNLMQTLLAADQPDGPLINWPEVAQLMLRRLDAEQLQRPDDVQLQHVRSRLAGHPRLVAAPLSENTSLDVVVPIKIQADGVILSLISMVAQFGAVQEISYSGVHIEMFFPADDATEQYFASRVS